MSEYSEWRKAERFRFLSIHAGQTLPRGLSADAKSKLDWAKETAARAYDAKSLKARRKPLSFGPSPSSKSPTTCSTQVPSSTIGLVRTRA
jgi:hypothetical protein